MEPIYYPVNDFGPVMKGLAIGGMGIFHVFLAQFAVGGGWLLCYLQWLAMNRPLASVRKFLDGYFKFLVLVSFVVGALTGVGMWFTSIQVSAPTIGLMVEEFHWFWAIEWTFFALEVVSGYAFYRYGPKLSDRTRLTLLALYTFAAWMSLFWINGILSWQLTPGGWTSQTRDVWSGFFNASFWPSLLYRTVAAWTIAALAAMVVVNFLPKLEMPEKRELIHWCGRFLLPMVFMPLLGVWYLWAMPADSRGWATGGSPAMTMFLTLSIGSSLLVGLYALIGIYRQHLYINGATALLLMALAGGATAGGEFVREGVRKPFTVRNTLYSNSVRPEQVKFLREVGGTSLDPYPLRNAERLPTPQLRTGALVFRQQCSICHTTYGVNALTDRTEHWDADQRRMNFAKLQRLKPFMPPFAGTPVELEALVQYVGWLAAREPKEWPDSWSQLSAFQQEHLLATIYQYLDDAGTDPATKDGKVAGS
jgi:cytochrome bd ubiquinol oxidase subunit I